MTWLDEDYGYSDHMVGQKRGPFYCGTVFCGHSTKRAARQCWKSVCDGKPARPFERKQFFKAYTVLVISTSVLVMSFLVWMTRT